MLKDRLAERRRVLVVEDDMLIALMIEGTLSDLGIEIVGPTGSVAEARQLASHRQVDAAVLDVNIRDGSSFPVADILSERGVPFVFTTGHGPEALTAAHRGRPFLGKPYTATELGAEVLKLLADSPVSG